MVDITTGGTTTAVDIITEEYTRPHMLGIRADRGAMLVVELLTLEAAATWAEDSAGVAGTVVADTVNQAGIEAERESLPEIQVSSRMNAMAAKRK
jgi:hypothetical protein